jgi:ferredoxin
VRVPYGIPFHQQESSRHFTVISPMVAGLVSALHLAYLPSRLSLPHARSSPLWSQRSIPNHESALCSIRLCASNGDADRERMLDALFSEPSQAEGMRAQPPAPEIPSHMTLESDDNGDPLLVRFTYVDEASCIGCTNCAEVARSTFFMEEDAGKARVFNQGGDSPEVIEEAIDTCPVSRPLHAHRHVSRSLALSLRSVSPHSLLRGHASTPLFLSRRSTASTLSATRTWWSSRTSY